MATKKAAATEEPTTGARPVDKRRAIEGLLTDINKKFSNGAGKAVVSRGNQIEPVQFVPTCSPALGYVLGTGGWARGKLTEIFGKEHSGKTTLTLLALKDCYEAEQGERAMGFVDLEHRFNESWARTLGLNLDDLIVVQPKTTEDATDVMKRLIESRAVSAVAFDSIGAALPEKAHNEFNESAAIYGGAAQVMGRNVRIIAPLANLYDTTVFYTNQLRADMDGYNRPMTPGGHAVKHMMSVRLYLRPGREKWMARDAEGKEIQVGFPMVFKVVKNTFGPPQREGWSDFYYEPSEQWLDHVGFDTDRDLQRLGIMLGLIVRGGAWYEYEGVRAQGRDKFFEELGAAGLRDRLMDDVKERLAHGGAKMAASGDEDDAKAPEAVGVDIEDPEV